MNITPYQHQLNLERLRQLNDLGYEFHWGADGYSVRYKGKFLGGASVKLPREKPLHWKHKHANIKDNAEQCLFVVRDHQK